MQTTRDIVVPDMSRILNKDIPFLPYKQLFQEEKEEFKKELSRIIDEGHFILGPDVEKFEQTLAEYVGTKYAVGVNSGTDALFLSLKAAGIGVGDEVITVSHTFIATIQTIAQTGATPILVDIDDTGLMDMEQAYRAITSKTRAIIPVHLEGKVCDMGELQDIVRGTNIVIIEDAAQALGATYEGKKVGSLGLTGCFSFYPAKIMGVPGDAGAITTNSEEIRNELVLLRNHYGIGKGVEGQVKYGYNSRLDNLQAAFLNVRFKRIDQLLVRRQEIAHRYDLGLPKYVSLPIAQEGRVYQDYVIRLNNKIERMKLKSWLDDHGIGTLGTDLVPNHLYAGLNLNFELPETVAYTDDQMRLPCNAVISNREVDYIIDTIKSYYDQK